MEECKVKRRQVVDGLLHWGPTRNGESPQHCPKNFFAVMEVFCICAVQYGSHALHAATEH